MNKREMYCRILQGKMKYCVICASCQSVTMITHHNGSEISFFASDFEKTLILISLFHYRQNP